MFQRGGEARARFSGLCRSQCRSLAKPHSEEYVAAAPVDGLQAARVRGRR